VFELRYALRSIRKSLASSLVSILVLAVGIGACTAVLAWWKPYFSPLPSPPFTSTFESNRLLLP